MKKDCTLTMSVDGKEEVVPKFNFSSAADSSVDEIASDVEKSIKKDIRKRKIKNTAKIATLIIWGLVIAALCIWAV